MTSEKEMYLQSWERESQTTLKVLRAFPGNRQDYKPHEIMKTARELAWVFASEEISFVSGVIAGKIDFALAGKAPATILEAINTYEKAHKEMVQKFKDIPEADLNTKMMFHVAPKTPGEVRKFDVLWLTLMDQIHHRGQFSIYLRLVGAKVPSIYGPTADEPWM